jgi:hypothetical protein
MRMEAIVGQIPMHVMKAHGAVEEGIREFLI